MSPIERQIFSANRPTSQPQGNVLAGPSIASKYVIGKALDREAAPQVDTLGTSQPLPNAPSRSFQHPTTLPMPATPQMDTSSTSQHLPNAPAVAFSHPVPAPQAPAQEPPAESPRRFASTDIGSPRFERAQMSPQPSKQSWRDYVDPVVQRDAQRDDYAQVQANALTPDVMARIEREVANEVSSDQIAKAMSGAQGSFAPSQSADQLVQQLAEAKGVSVDVMWEILNRLNALSPIRF